ncbi:putative quinol monooxygenase [Streptomyces sp. NPDC057486]|uniref:putative quinol monooxygenase n=1 Tax=Streptomyces sp. NPDC057486 TaxID=3346145 RepID=UPI0036A1FDC5
MSNGQLDLVFRFRVKPGKLEQFQKAIDHILPITEEKEPYVLEYNIYKNAEGVYTQHERYADEDAMFRHLEATAEGQKEWAEATEVEEVNVLGDASDRFWDLFGSPRTHAYSPFRNVKR